MAPRAPGVTADSVRWAFREGEYGRKRTSLFSNAITEVKTAVERRKKLRDDASRPSPPSPPIWKPGQLTFDDLPYDVKDIIFDMLRSSPSWVHYQLGEGRLISFSGGHQEMYVNKEWYQNIRLRQGLSYNLPLDRMLLGHGLCDAMEKTRRKEHGEREFYVRLDRDDIVQQTSRKSPFVRRQIDWFFFDGTADVDSMFWCLPQIRTCVVRIDDLYDAIPRDNEDTNHKEPLAPVFVWSAESEVEELVILVGEFRKDVQPSQMKDIVGFQFDMLPRVDANTALTMELDDFYPFVSRPEYKYSVLSESQGYMMRKISTHIARREYERRSAREEFLEEEDGKRHLANGDATWWDDFSRWTTTEEGDTWLSTDQGLSFLNSKTGHWWVAMGSQGSPWLETESGIRWLNTENAKEFLDSKWAPYWADKVTYEREDPGRQVRKAWLDTPAGREWELDHFPNNIPPPEFLWMGMPIENRPPYAKSFPRRAFHRNFNLRGWRFVMCPKESA